MKIADFSGSLFILHECYRSSGSLRHVLMEPKLSHIGLLLSPSCSAHSHVPHLSWFWFNFMVESWLLHYFNRLCKVERKSW
jgi:hypothetical protein